MAVTPGGRVGDASPLGKPGGQRGLTDYIREVAHALMRRGIPESKAIAIARSQQAKWALKSKNPAIRAASVKSLVEQHVLDHRKRGKHDMSRTSNFGGKKAAPFGSAARKSGKPMRPGSIPSGKGKGKFPITNQASVESAARLAGKAKGVSKAAVVAHIKSEVKRRGLKLPASYQK